MTQPPLKAEQVKKKQLRLEKMNITPNFLWRHLAMKFFKNFTLEKNVQLIKQCSF